MSTKNPYGLNEQLTLYDYLIKNEGFPTMVSGFGYNSQLN
jgi:hypothetical protein